jgi:hypothetical protein
VILVKRVPADNRAICLCLTTQNISLMPSQSRGGKKFADAERHTLQSDGTRSRGQRWDVKDFDKVFRSVSESFMER